MTKIQANRKIQEIVKKYDDLKVNVISTKDIVTADWVHMKCIYGCSSSGNNKLCPPNSISTEKAAKILTEYKKALLVCGKSRNISDQNKFMHQVLKLEKDLFLNNHYKAFSLMSGPCGDCAKCGKMCDTESRPCMCAFSIDVFSTVKKLGKKIKVLDKPQEYTCYAIILLE